MNDKVIAEFAYGQMVEKALRSVVREALSVTERQGLPGHNHFYITFRVDYPGVLISSRLKASHPETMTIVLQNQFWDLTVYEEAFGVTLSFSGRREHLTIPFEAITAFADPYASFGLQFEIEYPDDEDGEGYFDTNVVHPFVDVETANSEPVQTKEVVRILETLVEESRANAKKAEKPSSGNEDADSTDAGGNVITLDCFRKKP